MATYGNAQICLNGHVTTSDYGREKSEIRPYCERCGSKTITKCTNCNCFIRGSVIPDGFVSDIDYVPSRYCMRCGHPYPWQEAALKAAEELAALMEEFDESDVEILRNNLEDIAKESPRTQVAALKVKGLLRKLDPHVRTAFKDTLNGIVSEPIIKLIWG